MKENEEENKSAGAASSAPAETSASSPEGGDKPQMMEISVDKMNKILETVEALQEKDRQRDEEIEILRESVSRGALDEAEGKRKKQEPPRAKVMIHNGKIVTGWKMEKNELVYDPRNMQVPFTENLKLILTYADGEQSGSMPYVDFVRNLDRAIVTKVGENGIMWVVNFVDTDIRTEDLEIDPQFLNP